MSQHSQPKQRNWFARHKVLTAAGALVVIVGIGGALGSGDGDDGKASAASSAEKKEKKEKKGTAQEGTDKAAKGALRGSGTYQVGEDIKPGTYRSLGNKLGCYWERAKDSSGDPDAILANDNVVGASYVTVKAEDKIFKTQGCKSWELVPDGSAAGGSPKTAPKTEMPGNGMYKVGVDIAPGTYKSVGNKQDGCYWERAKDALHESADSILANENVTGNAVVTIAPGDAYFKTNGCSDWKKTG